LSAISTNSYYFGSVEIPVQIVRTLFGATAILAFAPAAVAPPGCDSVVLPVQKNDTSYLDPDAGNTLASQCALSPSGDWWRKRGADYFE